MEKITAAYDNQCLRFDSALNGIGGCPMAQDDLVGNLSTENMLLFLESRQIKHGLNKTALDEAMNMINRVFV